MSEKSDSIVRNPELLSRVGLSLSTVKTKVKNGTFPPPVKIGSRAIGWRASDIDRWIANLTTSTEVSE